MTLNVTAQRKERKQELQQDFFSRTRTRAAHICIEEKENYKTTSVTPLGESKVANHPKQKWRNYPTRTIQTCPKACSKPSSMKK